MYNIQYILVSLLSSLPFSYGRLNLNEVLIQNIIIQEIMWTQLNNI